MSVKTTENVIYTGRVQGVGFRYTVRTMAAGRPLTGFVRNLPDGAVELMVHGRPDDITALLADVAAHFSRNIDDCRRAPVESSEAFDRFEIRF